LKWGTDLSVMRRAPMLRALLDPVSFVPRAVEGRHWVLPLIAVCACVAFSGLSFASRLDASSTVLQKLDEAGELAKSSEREVNEAVEQAQRIALVGGAAKGLFVMPLVLLFIAVALKITAWLIGRKLLFAHAFTVAAVAFLPIAVFHLLFGLVALKQGAVVASQAASLLPSSLAALQPDAAPKLSRALATVDFFNLWAAALLGLGFAAGTKCSLGRGLALGLFLYLLVAALTVAAPGLSGGGAGGPS
jgi:hypothetical protein